MAPYGIGFVVRTAPQVEWRVGERALSDLGWRSPWYLSELDAISCIDGCDDIQRSLHDDGSGTARSGRHLPREGGEAQFMTSHTEPCVSGFWRAITAKHCEQTRIARSPVSRRNFICNPSKTILEPQALRLGVSTLSQTVNSTRCHFPSARSGA